MPNHVPPSATTSLPGRPARAGLALLLAAAMAAPMAPSPAEAQTRTLQTTGAWRSYTGASDDGTAMCGIASSHPPTGRELHVKFFRGADTLAVHLFKSSWQIPDDARVAVRVTVDNGPTMSAEAAALRGTNGRGMGFRVGSADREDFLGRLAAGRMVRVVFPQGNEPVWNGELRGAAEAVASFRRCVAGLGVAAPTQPFGAAPGAPTQPFGGGAPGAPTQPFAAPSPAPGSAPAPAPGAGTSKGR